MTLFSRIKRSGKRCVSLLFLFSYIGVAAQGAFTLAGSCPRGLGKSVTLTLYDGDTVFHKRHARIKDGAFRFEGSLAAPTAALLTFAHGEELYLYLEPAEMTIEVNTDDMEKSPVTGSRTNSQYRYAMESCLDNKNLAEYVRKNKSSAVTAFVLFRKMGQLELEESKRLYSVLDNEADSYHYHAIGKYLKGMSALAEGNRIPDFSYTDNGKTTSILDHLKADTATVVFFGAKWCDICEQQLHTIRNTCGDSITLVAIDLAEDKRGWDAPYVAQLNVTHIPYIIVVDREGNIYARDVRIWELERITKLISR